MAGRPHLFSEEEAVEKATQLFWTKGYEATSTEDLLTTMGIGKSSFYNSFKGKRQLFEKVIESFTNHAITGFTQDIEAGLEPISSIRSFFRKLASSPPDTHQKGCFMGNTIIEQSNIDTSLENIAIGRLKKMEELFQKQLIKAQLAGQLAKDADPAVMARSLVNIWNGLNITRRMYPDPGSLLPMIELQLSILKENNI